MILDLAILPIALLSSVNLQVQTQSEANARVIEGGAVLLKRHPFPLFGVVLPETLDRCKADKIGYGCYGEANTAVEQLSATESIRCKEVGNTRRYVCRAGTVNINEMLVLTGQAFPDPALGPNHLYARLGKIAYFAGAGAYQRPTLQPDRPLISTERK